MEQLPLSRDLNGQVHLNGTGPVKIYVDYREILGSGGQGTVFRAKVFDAGGTRVLMEVAAKIPKLLQDPLHQLRDEADIHALAWVRLPHVLRPLGFLAAHDPTGTPAMLVLEAAVPLSSFLEQVGPLSRRHLRSTKAIARIIFQLLRFIMAGNHINLMHRDIKVANTFVTKAHNLDLAGLSVGDFGAAQEGVLTEGGAVTYRAGVYTWNHTSPRMAAFMYDEMAAHGVPREEIALARQLVFFNELFGWARIAFMALADRFPPDVLYGASPADRARVPELGFGDVSDGVRHLLLFALDLLTVGQIDAEVNSDYVQGLGWYHTLTGVLAGNEDGV